MSLALHRAGLTAVMQSITGTTAGTFAQGFDWGFRNFSDTTLKWPFWTVESAARPSTDRPTVVGQGGLNQQIVASVITIFDKFSSTQDNEHAFQAMVDAALTALRKDANISLGQRAQGCTINRVVNYYLSYDVKNTPALRTAFITCQGEYLVPRT